MNITSLTKISILSVLIFNMASISYAQDEDDNDTERAVVKITGKNQKLGTGFVVSISDNKADILTAYHVVEGYDIPGQNEFSIKFKFDEMEYTAKVRREYREIDLAVLSLSSFPYGIRKLKFDLNKEPERGDQVYAAGYPGGGVYLTDDGKVKGISETKILLDDILPDEGYSGGPLLSAESDGVLGMILQRSNVAGAQYSLKGSVIHSFISSVVEIDTIGPKLSSNILIDETIDGAGLRLGASSHRDKLLFLDTSSSPYAELYISYLAPKKKYLGFKLGIEPSVGIDFVERMGFLSGVIYANGFLNIKAVNDLKESVGLPFKFSFGFGLGAQGIRFDFSPGEGQYGQANERDLKEGVIRLAANAFVETDHKITDSFRIHALVRWVTSSDEITDFSERDWGEYDPPIGGMGAFYVMFGTKFNLK